jgi:predicted Zn-ribbon and HTH transcriptional regulator
MSGIYIGQWYKGKEIELEETTIGYEKIIYERVCEICGTVYTHESNLSRWCPKCVQEKIKMGSF